MVPHPHAAVGKAENENCEYCNGFTGLKNCYLVFNAGSCEDCMYSNGINFSRNCVDCRDIDHCELCYECVKTVNCYNCYFSRACQDCNDCHLCTFCYGCQSCFGCTELRNKEYYWFNEKLTKEEYQRRWEEIKLIPGRIQELKEESYRIYLSRPHKYARIISCEDCSGDDIENSKNSHMVFDCKDNEDCKFCFNMKFNVKDCCDVTTWGRDLELSYESVSVGNSSSGFLFCEGCWESNDLIYCSRCQYVDHLFGCCGFRSHEQYCILNKKYSKEEYNELIPKIVEHMRGTGEWGNYFPAEISPYPYNDTLAMDHYPFSKQEVRERGYRWEDHEEKIPEVEKIIPAEKLDVLDNISEVPDDILNWAIECRETGKLFKIQKAELDFLRKANLPIPNYHPDVRYFRRVEQLGVLKLWNRKCDKEGCDIEFETTYAPERPEIVYCERCYQEEVF